MGYFELYKKRMDIYGNSIKESRKNASIDLIKSNFQDSPSHETVDITNHSGELVSNEGLQITDDSSLKKFTSHKIAITHPDNTLESGWLIEFNNENWLVTTTDYLNGMYYKALIKKTNNTFKIKTGETSEITGYDDMGRPITTKTPIFYETEAVVEKKLIINKFAEFDQPINLPDGRIQVTFTYSPSHTIKEGNTFDMYNSTFKILDVDYTQVNNDVGVLAIIGDKVVGGGSA